MRCNTFMVYIERYIDSKLSLQEREGFEMHLNSCQQCCTYYQKAKKLHQLLSTATPPLPFIFDTTIVAAIRNMTFNTDNRETFFQVISRLWLEASVAVRMVGMSMLVFTLTSGILIGHELTKTVNTTTLSGTPDLDAFSAIPSGSIESAFISMTVPDINGGSK